jgi:predicted component of type VI protein secretion system
MRWYCFEDANFHERTCSRDNKDLEEDMLDSSRMQVIPGEEQTHIGDMVHDGVHGILDLTY